MPIGIYNHKPHSKETKLKLSLAHKGQVPWNTNKKLSERHRQNIGKGLFGNTNTKGKPWSEARREAQKKISHKKHRYIRNGKIYCLDWYSLREKIYKRDNWTCQECGIKCHNGIKIQCHHIDYDVNNNDDKNLITLCASCHCKTNFLKKNWTNYFINKMKGEMSYAS